VVRATGKAETGRWGRLQVDAPTQKSEGRIAETAGPGNGKELAWTSPSARVRNDPSAAGVGPWLGEQEWRHAEAGA